MSNRDETTAQMKTRMNVWVLGAMMVLALALIAWCGLRFRRMANKV